MSRQYRQMIRLFFLIAVGACIFEVQAQVYKCNDVTGKVTYQQSPCETSSTGTKIKTDTQVQNLGQKEPEARIVSQCIKLYELSPDAPQDFRLGGAAYVPSSEGGWRLAISGTVLKSDSSRTPETLRCPVSGNGSINLDLWRAQLALGSIQKERRSEQLADAKAVGTASAASKGAPRESNLEKAGERKFIESKIKGGHLNETQVRQALGEPDSYGTAVGSCITQITHTQYDCRRTTWIYRPAPNDQQTRTTIEFTLDGEAIDIKRTIEY